MKTHIGLTIETELLTKIENLRGMTKRSTFIEHLLKLGLEAYTQENSIKPTAKKR